MRRTALARRAAALHPVRLARPIARHPGRVAVVAALACALAGAGFARFSVDAGSGLLVGSRSDAGQTYQQFSSRFGSDPIVVVFTARNPRAFFAEPNLLKLAALEAGLARDPRVASVLGPGTIAGAAQAGAAGEVGRVLDEYSAFVGETELLTLENQGDKDSNDLLKKAQSATQAAQLALLQSVVRATGAADAARTASRQAIAGAPQKNAGAKLIDSWEQSAEQAASSVDLPPLFADYLGAAEGHPGQADEAGARALFDRLTAGYGDCYGQIASALGLQSATCQVFLERVLLDLPRCPSITSQAFCPPKTQWSAVLPAARPGEPAHAILTVRLKANVASDSAAVRALADDIRSQLAHGRPHDSNANVRNLGALDPTECAGNRDTGTACMQQLHDAPLGYVLAGAPLLAAGVVGAATHLLVAILPVAFFVMVLLLLGAFRARGRIWPLPAAAGAVLLTVGGALLIGTPVTPAVLAGVPVLVGLGVDYGVQLVARFQEERGRGLGIEAALRQVLGRTGPATLIAAVATGAGLVAMALVAGMDLGPLAAVPLVAEFALVLLAGVVFSWLAAVLIALPAAAWAERRRERRGDVPEVREAVEPVIPVAARTAGLATRWRAVVVPAAVLALVGWALIPRVPVQTDVERLLAPSLQELQDVQQVRALTGFDNELDVFVQGRVLGPYDQATPANALWQQEVAQQLRCVHPEVVSATSVGDLLSAGTSGGGTSTNPCAVPGGSSGSGGTSPSPSPSSSASPKSRVPDDIVRAGAVLPQGVHAATATAPPSAAATPAPAGAATPGASAVPSPVATATPQPKSAASSAPPQTPFVCALRLFPSLAGTLVDGFGASTQSCPPRDLFRSTFLVADPTPVSADAARIPLGVRLTSVAAEARLVDALRTELAHPPAGITAAPTGLTVLATQAYENLTTRGLMLNLVPLVVVALVLLAIYREPKRALLPVLPTALAAGWAPLIVVLLGRLPGDAGVTLGSLNPLTVVLGALVVALATEFGVVLLQRFYEEIDRGRDADEAAGAALGAVGRAIRVSALTLGAGFAVLAVSGLFPGGIPLVADFGLAVVIDLALAVAAVFLVMLPVAVALERRAPDERTEALVGVAAPGRGGRERPRRVPAVERLVATGAASGPAAPAAPPAAEERGETPVDTATVAGVDWLPAPVVTPDLPEPVDPEEVVDTGWESEPEAAAPAAAAEPPPPAAPPPGLEATTAPAARRLPGMSGRRRPPAPDPEPPAPAGARTRLPGLSGRRRAGTEAATAAPAAVDPRAEPAAPDPPRRRRPGGVVPRWTTPPTIPPEVAPASDLDAGAPVDLRPAGGLPAGEAGEPEDDHPAPATAGTGDGTGATAALPEPVPGGPPRSRPRRRRPPPHIRRQGH